jgi:DNA mismatch repair protein MutL
VNSAERFVKVEDVPATSSGKIHPIGQLHESFIVATDNEGLLLIDQHVAHERILFDKFKTRGAEAPVESQNLLLPETIDLTHPERDISFDRGVLLARLWRIRLSTGRSR